MMRFQGRFRGQHIGLDNQAIPNPVHHPQVMGLATMNTVVNSVPFENSTTSMPKVNCAKLAA